MGSAEQQRENVSGPGVATGAAEASSCNTKSFQTPGYSQIKMLCDPVRDGGSEEASSLQPWQIYSGLFLGFWAFSAFFNHLAGSIPQEGLSRMERGRKVQSIVPDMRISI